MKRRNFERLILGGRTFVPERLFTMRFSSHFMLVLRTKIYVNGVFVVDVQVATPNWLKSLHSNNKKQIVQIKHNIKWVNTQLAGRRPSGTGTQDRWISSPAP